MAYRPAMTWPQRMTTGDLTPEMIQILMEQRRREMTPQAIGANRPNPNTRLGDYRRDLSGRSLSLPQLSTAGLYAPPAPNSAYVPSSVDLSGITGPGYDTNFGVSAGMGAPSSGPSGPIPGSSVAPVRRYQSVAVANGPYQGMAPMPGPVQGPQRPTLAYDQSPMMGMLGPDDTNREPDVAMLGANAPSGGGITAPTLPDEDTSPSYVGATEGKRKRNPLRWLGRGVKKVAKGIVGA